MNDHRIERRKNKRYQIEVGALNLLKCNSDEKVGEIINISRGGLAYLYTSNEGAPNGPSEFDIFWVGNRRLLSNVPCETVTDFRLPKKGFFDFNRKRVRGIRFGKLNEQQIAQIEYCIQKHSIIEA